MKKLYKLGLAGGLMVSLPVILSGCLGMQSQSTLDAIQEGMSAQPVTEAYIEYPGPQSKWAGPTNFILHVSAKDTLARISVTPALFDEAAAGISLKGRAPASMTEGAKPGQKVDHRVEMTGGQARDQLAHLAASLTGGAENFRGCLSPLRVRMIHADGAVTEKQGCRGQTGWSKAASESVNTFISAALYGMSKT